MLGPIYILKVFIWVIDQLCEFSQDSWILVKVFFACLWTETESRASINSQKENKAHIQPSWPNKLAVVNKGCTIMAFREIFLVGRSG